MTGHPAHLQLRDPDARHAEATHLARLYRDGLSIRQIAAHTGRSYCYVRTLLQEASVQLRPRGGAHYPHTRT